MRRFDLLATAAVLLSSAFVSAPAYSQIAITFISGSGDDSKTCNRSDPCRTLTSALSKTTAHGQINCLDGSNFNGASTTPLMITKTITINCEGAVGGFFSFASAIEINAGASDDIYLKGLDIIGQNGSDNGFGVKVTSAKSVTIENSQIHGFNLGVQFAPTTATFLNIINSTLTQNGLPATGGAIALSPASSGYGIVTLHNTRIVRNYIGIGGSTTGAAFADITGSTISGNSGDAISVSGNVTVRIGHSTITGNGGRATSGNVLSYGNNQINGNSPDTIPSAIASR